MTQVLNIVLIAAVLVHFGLAATCIWRVWRGENLVDRLLSADVIGTLALCTLLLIAMLRRDGFFVDAGFGLAALGAIGTIALARMLAVGQVKPS